MERTSFSVIIATYRRPERLRGAVASILAQAYPPDRVELIVVDNASEAPVRRLVEELAAPAPIPVTYLAHEVNGVSAARNRGAAAARFDYVAFLDDDALADPAWLADYDAIIHEQHAVAIGGQTVPVAEGVANPPSWFAAPFVQGMFGANRRGKGATEARRIDPFAEFGFGGGNSAYARRLFLRFGGFLDTQGRTGRSLRASEDTYLNLVLAQHGVPVHVTNGARIRHIVETDRLSEAHLRRRAFWHGVSSAEVRVFVSGRSLLPRALPSQLAKVLRGIRSWRSAADDAARFAAQCVLLDRIGVLLGLLGSVARTSPYDPAAVAWGPRDWLEETLRWPEGIEKQRRLFELYTELGDEPAARAALDRIVASMPELDEM